MTTIAEALRTYIISDVTVGALVSTRMYPNKLPQNPTMPAITYQYIGGDSVMSHDGASGLGNPIMQIDCWGSTYSEMDALFEAVRKRINGAKGTLSGVQTQGIFLARRRDLYEYETKLHRRSSDWSVWSEEALT